jgi:hypothetical protein
VRACMKDEVVVGAMQLPPEGKREACNHYLEVDAFGVAGIVAEAGDYDTD